jgi:hypothetical protein
MVSKSARFIHALHVLKLLTDSRVERGHTNLDSRDIKYRQKGHRGTNRRVREQRHRATAEGTESRRRRRDTDSRDIQRSTGTRTHRIYPTSLSADFAEVQYGRIKLIRISSFIFYCKYAKRASKKACDHFVYYIMNFVLFSLFLQCRCSIIQIWIHLGLFPESN